MQREPAVAGQFYPANAGVLAEQVRRMSKSAAERIAARAIVVPHAGYVYSGEVAGAVYGAVRLPRRYILLGPNHTGWGAPLALHPPGDWRTPLGSAPIDAELNERLRAETGLLALDSTAHRREHALEVQIPFLQALAGEIAFAAICVGTSEPDALAELGGALARVASASPDPVLLVASTDMNHYEPAALSEGKDRLAIERILEIDPAGLRRVVREADISMCGFAPTVAVLEACRRMETSHARLLRYAHSGQVSGDYKQVVGYAGIAIW